MAVTRLIGNPSLSVKAIQPELGPQGKFRVRENRFANASHPTKVQCTPIRLVAKAGPSDARRSVEGAVSGGFGTPSIARPAGQMAANRIGIVQCMATVEERVDSLETKFAEFTEWARRNSAEHREWMEKW